MKRAATAWAAVCFGLGAAASAGEKSFKRLIVDDHIKNLYAAKYAVQESAFLQLLAFGVDAEDALGEERRFIEEKLTELPNELAERKRAVASGKTPESSRGRKLIKREMKDLRIAKVWVEALLAEIDAFRDWRKDIPPQLKGKLDVAVDLSFKDEPLPRALESAGRQAGAEVVLSPAAALFQKVAVVEVTGRPSLGEFLDWVCQQFELRLGAAGGKIVVSPRLAGKKMSRPEVSGKRPGGKQLNHGGIPRPRGSRDRGAESQSTR